MIMILSMHGPSRCRYVGHMFLANLFKQSQVVLIVIVCKIHHSAFLLDEKAEFSEEGRDIMGEKWDQLE